MILLGDSSLVKEGDIVKCTGKILNVPVGDNFIGRVINPLGAPIDGLGPIESTEYRPIEQKLLVLCNVQALIHHFKLVLRY